MTRRVHRKSEAVRLRNEHDFPYLGELALPTDGFRDVVLEIDTFHRERCIPVRRAARIDTRSSKSIFVSASPTPPLRMHSAIASVASA
jgi:hypothetical protein